MSKAKTTIDFESFDFSNITPKPGGYIKWKPRRYNRRKQVKGIGKFVEQLPNGNFLVSYTWGTDGLYKTKRIEIDPRYVVDYKEPGKEMKECRR